ncbi:hypothetical protein KA005_31410, partial [bacterium]|nr:hypothetical protein [bacterium]
DMWDDHTEDIFDSVTIEQALRTPNKYWGGMSQHMRDWAAKALFHSSTVLESFAKYKLMPKLKGRTIKFRRYGIHETVETMVGGFICKECSSLGKERQIGSYVAGNLSDYGDCTEFRIQEVQKSTEEAQQSGKEFTEGK